MTKPSLSWRDGAASRRLYLYEEDLWVLREPEAGSGAKADLLTVLAQWSEVAQAHASVLEAAAGDADRFRVILKAGSYEVNRMVEAGAAEAEPMSPVATLYDQKALRSLLLEVLNLPDPDLPSEDTPWI